MEKLNITAIVSAMLGVILSTNAAALPILIVDSGQLLGATNVDVGGLLYDVQITDGSCIALFGGCDQQSDFRFGDAASANAASQALLDLVFLDIAGLGNFDSTPSLIRGVESSSGWIFTPFGLIAGFNGSLFPGSSAAINSSGPSDSVNSSGGPIASWDMSTSPSGESFTWAVWSASTGQTPDDYYPQVVVPEPATFALLGIGLAGFGFARSKRLLTA